MALSYRHRLCEAHIHTHPRAPHTACGCLLPHSMPYAPHALLIARGDPLPWPGCYDPAALFVCCGTQPMLPDLAVEGLLGGGGRGGGRIWRGYCCCCCKGTAGGVPFDPPASVPSCLSVALKPWRWCLGCVRACVLFFALVTRAVALHEGCFNACCLLLSVCLASPPPSCPPKMQGPHLCAALAVVGWAPVGPKFQVVQLKQETV